MKMRWRVTATSPASTEEVVLVPVRQTADMIARSFDERGYVGTKIEELPLGG